MESETDIMGLTGSSEHCWIGMMGLTRGQRASPYQEWVLGQWESLERLDLSFLLLDAFPDPSPRTQANSYEAAHHCEAPWVPGSLRKQGGGMVR